MSLEDAIKELTDAVKANTAALKAGGGSTGGKAASGGKAADKPKKTTLDQVAKAFGAYLSAEGDDAKPVVKKINGHFGVKKVSEIPEDKFDEALELLKQYQDGEDPLSGGEDDLM
jgi:hypothetical protein